MSSAIMGVGSVRGRAGVRWGVARQIVMAWILTIPACAITAAICYGLLSIVF
jgi:PiT family inorganic phosphate transporter